MSNRQWIPFDYVDEISPPGRETPDAWIERTEAGRAILSPIEGGDSFRLTPKVGDVVPFYWQEQVAELQLRVWSDHHVLDGDAPPASSFNRVCTTYGDGGFVDSTLDELIDQVRADGLNEEPLTISVFFYLDSVKVERFRLIDNGGALSFAPAAQLS